MRVFGLSDGRGGVHHYRIREPLRGLSLLGHETGTGEHMRDFGVPDVLLVRALHTEVASKLWRSLKGKIILVYDLDDDIWAWHPSTASYHAWGEQQREQAELNLQTADLVTTPSIELAKILRQLNPRVKVLPNTIPHHLIQLRTHTVRTKFIVGWQGAEQHVRDLELIYNPVFSFMTKHANVELHLWGPSQLWKDIPKGLAERIVCHPWEPSVWRYYYSLDMDIGLAPLRIEDHFSITKSGIKVQEYGALGIPCIASDGPAYNSWVVPGITGFLARHEDDWREALETLYKFPDERGRMGIRARHRAEKHWTTESNARDWELAYERAREGREDRAG